MGDNIIPEQYAQELLEDSLQYSYQDVLVDLVNKLQRKKKIQQIEKKQIGL